MCRQRKIKPTHPENPKTLRKYKVYISHQQALSSNLTLSWTILPTKHFIGPHRGAGLEILKPVKARFWSKNQKTRDHPEPSISVLNNAFLTGTRADPGVPLIWGVFGGKLSSLSRGGRSLREGGVSEDYFAFTVEKYDPKLGPFIRIEGYKP